MTLRKLLLFLLLLSCVASLSAQSAPSPATSSPDLSRQPTVYVVGYAHLDTEWRWEYPQVIREFLPKTLHDNFALFEKYPHYIFNFSGANRYRMIKEYYPADFETLRRQIAAGRWFPAGSSMEESDVNSPSAESVFRQVLYGNKFFQREFGKSSAEYMLPDCFGFPASLPSILAHAGVKGFSTQKLTWGSSAPVGGPGSPEETPVGTPFNVGLWQGPDGRSVMAAMNPGSYSADIRYDITRSDAANPARDYVDWPRRVERDGKVSGLFTDYHYYGTGDTGGSPRESSVRLVEAMVTRSKVALPSPQTKGPAAAAEGSEPAPEVQVGDGPLHIISSTAEQMFLDIRPEQMAGLPRYQGDLELTNHSAGSLTSEAYQKRWNRKNELLADAAEKASVAAQWLGARAYPLERLNQAWTLVMGGQFHDIAAGTATPQAYEFSWNDDVLAANQFSGVLTSAITGIASALDTRGTGVPIVVYNPLNIAREDVVEANLSFPGGTPKSVHVTGPDGKEVPAQLEGTKVLFLAKAPSVGFAVYNVSPGAAAAAAPSALRATRSSLENSRYKITLDANGDISSIVDKQLKKELLAAPVRLAFQTEKPHDWPAWNMDWEDQQKPPRAFVSGPSKIAVVENGPVRVAVQVERSSEDSTFVQTVRLSSGDAGNRVEFGNVIDWKTAASALKATFPLSASNPQATYNWDVGTIQRGNNDEKKFEVASHQWFDLTDTSGGYGVTILSDCKYGSDKPDDRTLRLTLLYTPGLGQGNGRFYSDQTSQDWGHHEFTYGLASHAGDWRKEQSDWQALRLNQPLIAFQSNAHAGMLGRSFSLMHTSSSRVRVLALKKAELSDEVIVRMVEMDGQLQPGVKIAFAAPIVGAREITSQELPLEGASQPAVAAGVLQADFGAYQPRTFALRLAPAQARAARVISKPIELTYDLNAASRDGQKSDAGFDADHRALPAEMLPAEITYGGIDFHLAPAGQANALIARGQTIKIPVGFNRIFLLAASSDGDQKAAFKLGSKTEQLTIENWGGFIGQWDDRLWNKKQEVIPPRPGSPNVGAPRTRTVLEYMSLKAGFIKPAPVAWFASHHHTADGQNEPYAYSYLFAYALDVPTGATTLTLPENDKIRIMAVTAANETSRITPAQPLFDTLNREAPAETN